MKLSLRRKFKGSRYTIGDLSIDGTFFCNTIEDVVRELPDSCPDTSRWIPCKCKEKNYARTAIPTGTYKVTKLLKKSTDAVPSAYLIGLLLFVRCFAILIVP